MTGYKRNKLFTFQNAIILASIIPVVFFGFLTYSNSKKELDQKAFEYIQNENRQKLGVIREYFKNVEFNMRELSTTISFLEKQAKNNIKNIQILQLNNIVDHYHSVEKDILSLSKKSTFQYIFDFLRRGKTVDDAYFQEIKEYKNNLGLKNILMIDLDGNILYSADRDDLLNMNVRDLTASFKKVFDEMQEQKETSSVSFIQHGFEKKSQSYKHYAIVRFQDVKGYIALEIDQDILQKSIADVVSLGETAETYLLYKENNETFLATNRDVKDGSIGDVKTGFYIDQGFSSQGVAIKYGSLGNIELVGYIPLKIKNITYSLQTTVAYTEVISPIIKGRDYFEKFIQEYAYHNMAIVDPKGYLFYSIRKGKNFNKNIFELYGEESYLVKAIQQVVQKKEFVLTDIEPCSESEDGMAQFALMPIINLSGDVQSIAIVQLMSTKISTLLQENDTIYKSYESYIVGEDKKLRSDTRLGLPTYSLKHSINNNIIIDTAIVRDAFEGTKENRVVEDYRGKNVFSTFSLLEYPNFKWAMITEIDQKEVESYLASLKENIFLFVIISSFVALTVMLIITSEKKKQDKKLNYTATHDDLTGLPNRKFALEFLSYMLANQKRLKTKGAVLFIDLDKFKIINDSYGHEKGDFILVEVAKRLRNLLREEDLVARLGGDEFIVVLNNFEHPSDIDRVCHKIIDSVSKPIEDGERSYEIGMSVGIAIFPQDSNSAEDLLQFADTAMYRTKDKGRNGFTYYSKEMTENSLRISRVEDELKHAIENNELQLCYQPQIHLEDQRVIGVEALVRWNHPRDGFITPNEFIPIAEESNLIIDLGDWVLREACSAFLRWKEAGIEMDYVAVNMSPKQLQCSGCVEKIVSIFEELDFKPEWLELEITESTLIENLEHTLQNINIFKEMGIKFSIDDFGTGYSSLAYLKSLRISTLKIDREFIKDIMNDKDDRSIVNAIIAMGHTMNYVIVAEGAEHKEEVTLLRYLACDIIQGYYFSKPLKEQELITYIKNENWIK